jgi:Xaa-Pro aminopeptidase
MIPSNEFESRRQHLFDMMDGASALLVFAGVPKVSSADEDLPFEVNRNFYYLTGIAQEGSALLLINSDGEMQEFLFVLPYDPKKERWYGKRLTPFEASVVSGIPNVLISTSLPGKIDAIFNPSSREFGPINKLYLDQDREIKIAECTSTRDYKNTIKATYADVLIADCYPFITTLRLRKSNHEVDELRSAIATTKLGLSSVWNKMKPGKKEYELADEFLRAINDDNHYQGLSFPTIMASGVHGATLHYPTPMATIKDGDLVLMDLGARNNFYCADVTRTLPANGKFTPEQLDIYNIVLGCNKMVASMAKPGVTINALQDATVDYLGKACLAKGYIKDKDELINYYFHSISHFIGLDTHDPYLNPLDKGYKAVPLEAGMIISDEPGLYMEDRGIGVRIEDDLLITNDGCEVLTSGIIKEPKDLERFLASRHKSLD